MRMGTYYRAELIKSLGLDHSQGRILDIGGYDGFMLSLLDAPEKVSVDIETIPLHPGIRYCLGDGLNLPFRDESFDTIYALDVLEHVDNEESFAQELVRVLKPGGRIILTTPHKDIRIFPGFIQSWVNRRWQHYRVSGYSEAAVTSLFLSNRCASSVRKLSIPWFRWLYVPLSALWRLSPSFAHRVIARIARIDATRGAGAGYVLAEVHK